MRDVGVQEGEVEGCDGNGKEVDDGYKGHCEGSARRRAGSCGDGCLERGGAGEVDQE